MRGRIIASAGALMLLLVSPALAQRQYIRAPSGTNLGYTIESGHRITAYSRSGTRLGYYDSRTNKTYDRTGRIVATGNIVTCFIVR